MIFLLIALIVLLGLFLIIGFLSSFWSIGNFAIISIFVTLVLAAGFSLVCDKLVPLLCPPNPRKR